MSNAPPSTESLVPHRLHQFCVLHCGIIEGWSYIETNRFEVPHDVKAKDLGWESRLKLNVLIPVVHGRAWQ